MESGQKGSVRELKSAPGDGIHFQAPPTFVFSRTHKKVLPTGNRPAGILRHATTLDLFRSCCWPKRTGRVLPDETVMAVTGKFFRKETGRVGFLVDQSLARFDVFRCHIITATFHVRFQGQHPGCVRELATGSAQQLDCIPINSTILIILDCWFRQFGKTFGQRTAPVFYCVRL